MHAGLSQGGGWGAGAHALAFGAQVKDMPPKASTARKADDKKKEKLIEDKTFGLKVMSASTVESDALRARTRMRAIARGAATTSVSRMPRSVGQRLTAA